MTTRSFTIEVQPDFLERQARATPVQAVAELIWNGLDADASRIAVRIDTNELPKFVDAIAALQTEEDYSTLLNHYGIRRTDKKFWPHSDYLHAAYKRLAPLEAGLFDYNRLENR